MRFMAFGKNEIEQGDSFYIETINNCQVKAALIDGGQRKTGFADMLIEEANVSKLDVVACTHDDADHTNGIISLLSNPKSIKIKELWLPATWATFMDIVRGFDSEELLEKMMEINQEIFISSSKKTDYSLTASENLSIDLDDYEIYHEDFGTFTNDKGFLIDEGEINLNDILLNSEKLDFEEIWSIMDQLEKDGKIREISKQISLLKVLKVLKNIFEISKLAVKNGILIKWFEYKEIEKLDAKYIHSPIIPLNAIEVLSIKIKTKKLSYIFFKALTRVNKESLVFVSNNDICKNNSIVLFTSDGNLDANEIKHLNRSWYIKYKHMLITVPHHGSFNNEDAYWRVIKGLETYGNKIWVCGYNRHVRRGSWYLCQIGLGEKYCTSCEGETLKFISSSKGWSKYNSLIKRNCICKVKG